ncbi:hypothetical protein GCM10022280_00180 [Sphingomonas swuensis]|uniref:Beta/gamma crystallin 'Greek key' domain-containing protein n=1 Tax=Sphingomonas swuensis TaxID=977800 RepID=A0ABP7S6Y0_9SPHN
MTPIILALALAVSPASAPGNAAIDYANTDGIRDFHADNDRGIYLRDRLGHWYYGAFTARCPGVLDGFSVGFDTNGFQRFDRSSRVVTPTMTCALASLDRSVAPAAKGGPKR